MTWKQIKEYPSYEVCNDGTIRSKDRFVKGKTESNKQFIKGLVLKQYKQESGYLRVCLFSSEGKRKHQNVHRIVAEHFVEGKSQEKKYVNHIDGDKTNNTAVNLEWCTPSENMRHAVSMGLVKSGSSHHLATIDEKKATMIRVCVNLFSNKDCSEIFSVSQAVVQGIKSGRAWKQL